MKEQNRILSGTVIILQSVWITQRDSYWGGPVSGLVTAGPLHFSYTPRSNETVAKQDQRIEQEGEPAAGLKCLGEVQVSLNLTAGVGNTRGRRHQ